MAFSRLTNYLRRRAPAPPSRSIDFTGDYACWADAERQCTGYSAPVILERTCASLLKVKRGEAVYERDSVLFDRPEYAFPALTGLLRAALLSSGRLSVVDVGGSLGSTYFQLRQFLRAAKVLEWSVVEQAAHVRCGRDHFEDRELRFYETIDECLASHRPNVLLLSGVLQCLPDPYGTLAAFLEHRPRHVIIDRTPFLASDRDRLTVQTVPEWIYPARYPAWFFSETKFTGVLTAAGYSLVTDFAAADDFSPPGERGYYKGFIYDLASQSSPAPLS
jgi:putative methyltransferase (TIGR04325 family)